ncbi:ATP-binding protein [Kitasatospora sp. HPMI-4]|uniref:ATP-binding protein n=1 Tax=Kitasatospora sp. HPMI-4 TaxID=3448443 RepID=UPI003F1BB2D9
MHDLSDLPCSEGITVPEWLDRAPTVLGEYSAWLPRHRKSAGTARALLRVFLADMESTELFADVGELVVTELVGNAVRHARTTPGRLIFVRFEVQSGLLRIEVHDASGERPTVRAAGVDDEAGRGMWLVDQLSVRWGCCPRAGGVGKAVWALVGPADGDAR